MENQGVGKSFAKGLEPVMCLAAIECASPLFARFALLQECESSNHRRCFVAREHSEIGERTVQLRVFSAADADKESELLAFLLEAKAAAELSHKHIASSTNPDQLGDVHFYVSEHPAAAVTLRSRLNCKGWLDVEETLQITTQIVEALQYAHQAEIWHLKLQPECVWIDPDNHITLTDFGIPSKPLRPWAYQRRSQACSLSYRSPEQLDGKLPDERSDLYGVGVLLYEMLTDVLPFNAQDEKQLRHKIALKKTPPVHLIRPDIPEPLSAMVAQLLSENPADRFQNAALLQAALNQIPNTKWQAVDLQTEDFSKADELKEEERQVEPGHLSSGFDEPETGIDSDQGELLNAPEEAVFKADEICQSVLVLPALTHRQNAIVEAMTAPYSPVEEKPEKIRLPVVGSAKRWEFLPFAFMTLGILLLTAVSVLAVKGDFKNLFNPSAVASQTTVSTTVSVMEKSDAPASNPQATGGSSDQVNPEPPSPQESATPSEVNSASGNPVASKESNQSASAQALILNKPSTSRSSAPEVSRLRQQLRRINEAKTRTYKIRKSSLTARSGQAKPRKRPLKWRIR